MRSISVELRFEIDKHRTARGKFIIGDSLLEFRVALVHFGVECSGVKFLPRYGKFVDERQVKTAKALNGGITPAFRERRSAATRNENRGGTEQNISRHKRRVHMEIPEVADVAPTRIYVSRLEDRGSVNIRFAQQTHGPTRDIAGGRENSPKNKTVGGSLQPHPGKEFASKRATLDKLALNYSETLNAAQR